MLHTRNGRYKFIRSVANRHYGNRHHIDVIVMIKRDGSENIFLYFRQKELKYAYLYIKFSVCLFSFLFWVLFCFWFCLFVSFSYFFFFSFWCFLSFFFSLLISLLNIKVINTLFQDKSKHIFV